MSLTADLLSACRRSHFTPPYPTSPPVTRSKPRSRHRGSGAVLQMTAGLPPAATSPVPQAALRSGTAPATHPAFRDPPSLSDTGRLAELMLEARRLRGEPSPGAAPGGKAACLALREAQTRTKRMLKAHGRLLLTSAQLGPCLPGAALPAATAGKGQSRRAAAAASPVPLPSAPLLRTRRPHSLLPPRHAAALALLPATAPTLVLNARPRRVRPQRQGRVELPASPREHSSRSLPQS